MAARRVLFITGARSEYDILLPVARACLGREDMQPAVIAGAGHLSPFHGSTLKLIQADGLPIAATVESLLASDSWEGRALSFGHFYEGVCRALAHDRPNLLIVAGDREEALAGALAGNFLQIPVAHLFGGDRCIASDIDEVFRPAISKLAHLHFTATENHRNRLIKMGELPENVWTVGATSLDRLAEEPMLATEELEAQVGADLSAPFFLLIQHPSPNMDAAATGEQMRIVMEAVSEMGHLVFCSYPNFDPGNFAMRNVLEEISARRNNVRLFHTLPRAVFVNLFRRCAAIVGNSSSIVIEAGFLKVAGILVGPRQDLREVGPNVLRADFNRAEIQGACSRALNDADFRQAVGSCASLYGDGGSGPRVAALLAQVALDSRLLMKTIGY